MKSPLTPRIGGTLSADIAVPEHEREVRFYSRVLTTGEDPLWREDLMNNLGMPIIGLGERSPEYAELPLQWMPHIQVADVAASAKRALELGGTELLHGKDDDGNSQWAVLVDPYGAAFGIIPVVSADEFPPIDDAEEDVGHIAWIGLTVSDAKAASDFYRQVVGWSMQEVEARDFAMADPDATYTDYDCCGEDGEPAARICHARGVNLDMPTVWMLHLPVGDLDESLRRVGEEGGVVISGTFDEDGGYAHAVIQDPVGAYVALVVV